jgi:hypothetical protein
MPDSVLLPARRADDTRLPERASQRTLAAGLDQPAAGRWLAAWLRAACADVYWTRVASAGLIRSGALFR